MLTQRQKDLLDFINSGTRARGGVCPSYREMATAMGLSSIASVSRLLGGLEERGFIRRLPHRARAVEVVKRSAQIDLEESIASVPPIPRLYQKQEAT